MKLALILIMFLIGFAAVAKDITISDFVGCGIILKTINDPRLNSLIVELTKTGVSDNDINIAIQEEFKYAMMFGKHNWLIKAKQSCEVLGYAPITIND